MNAKIVFSRTESTAEVVERLIAATSASIEAALYRLNSPRLTRSLEEAIRRGVGLRLVLDRIKYKECRVTRELLLNTAVPFRLLHGRQGPGSKMHHKFVILDRQTVLTGSYNWTMESEEQNYENLVFLRDPDTVRDFTREFEALWEEAAEAERP